MTHTTRRASDVTKRGRLATRSDRQSTANGHRASASPLALQHGGGLSVHALQPPVRLEPGGREDGAAGARQVHREARHAALVAAHPPQPQPPHPPALLPGAFRHRQRRGKQKGNVLLRCMPAHVLGSARRGWPETLPRKPWSYFQTPTNPANSTSHHLIIYPRAGSRSGWPRRFESSKGVAGRQKTSETRYQHPF
eukprot:1020884-Rhodomonas_salina.5